MNVTTSTASQTPSLSLPVPAAIHLTTDQLHIQLLQRSTKLRLNLNAQALRGLRLEENWLCLRPASQRSVAERTRVTVLGEKILRVEDQIEMDEKHERWLETVWVASVE